MSSCDSTPECGKDGVAAATEVGQRYLLRLIGLLSIERGANGESE